MEVSEAIRQVIHKSKIPPTRIGLELGKTRPYVHAILNNGNNPKIETVIDIFNVCGYALCAIPKEEIVASTIVLNNHQENERYKLLEGEKRMFSSLFDWEMSDQTLHDSEELYHIDTGNPMDAIYFTASAGTPSDEIEDYASFAMRKRFGSRGASMVKNIEKVEVDAI